MSEQTVWISMDMEPPLGVGTAGPGDNDARDGPDLFAGAGAAHAAPR